MNINISILWTFIISLGISSLIQAQNTDEKQIRVLINSFSESVMSSGYDGIANAYTIDGKTMPEEIK